jgi:hypothetical protein
MTHVVTRIERQDGSALDCITLIRANITKAEILELVSGSPRLPPRRAVH